MERLQSQKTEENVAYILHCVHTFTSVDSLCVRWGKIQFVKFRDKLNNSKVHKMISGITNSGPYPDTQMLKVGLRGTRFVLWD